MQGQSANRVGPRIRPSPDQPGSSNGRYRLQNRLSLVTRVNHL